MKEYLVQGYVLIKKANLETFKLQINESIEAISSQIAMYEVCKFYKSMYRNEFDRAALTARSLEVFT